MVTSGCSKCGFVFNRIQRCSKGYSFHSEMDSFFEDSPKCMLYRYVFDPNMLQLYLDHAVNYIYKPFICKYRISAHCLNIENG